MARATHFSLLLAMGFVAVLPAAAQAKTVLVIGTHPDDEVLMAAGRTRVAHNAGDTIKVLVVTNGDVAGVADGLRRQGESVDSAMHLGLAEQDVIFFGYPDGSLLQLYEAPADDTVITSVAGQTATYGERGLGGMEYHRFVTGTHAPYTRASVREDFEMLIADLRPDEIYAHSDFEWHNDHQATALFVTEALVSLKRQGVPLHTKLYQSVVWMPDGILQWPQLDDAGWAPNVPFLPDSPPCASGLCLDRTAMDWKRVIHFAQPAEMLLADPYQNMKATALPFGGPGWFGSFTRKDEFFWLSDFGSNLAITATVTASSENTASGLFAAKAADGLVRGFDGVRGFEWATAGQLAGAWLELTWPAPVRIAQVNLWNRANTGDEIQAGTLFFGDGTALAVGALPSDGRVLPVAFAPKTVSSVRFRADQATGGAVGLAEIQVLGAPASSTENVSPHFIEGPTPLSRTLAASATTTISVVANDVDGDVLDYQWTAEAGTITGSGATIEYVAPAVSVPTWYAVGVTVSDGRGGTATNWAFVEVTPAPTSTLGVSPAVVFAGDPATGTIALAGPAPAGGLVVPLASSDPSIVTVPANATVPAGGLGATFPVTTLATTAGATLVNITATFPEGARSASLGVVPISVALLSVAPTSVLGGAAAVGTVTLPAPAGPAGALVQLTSSAPATVSVPASLAIPAGATSAAFSIATSPVATPTPVTLIATWGTSATVSLTVSPFVVTSLALVPGTVQGGTAAQGTVTLSGPAPAGGLEVALSSSVPTAATVPASVMVPAGNSSAAFQVTTSAVTASTSVAIAASLGGSSAAGGLTVTPDAPPPSANLITNPEQIGGTGWDAWGSLSVTPDAAVAPDGSAHAERVVSDGGGHALRWSAIDLTELTTYTFSFFARNHGGTAASYSVHDLSHGVDVVPPTSYIAQLASDRYTRVTVTFTTPAGCTAVAVYPLRDSGGPVDVLLWGARLELGSTATGYENLGEYHERFESGTGGWADQSGQPPTLATDASSSGGATVMAVNRSASGGDYYSPWIAVTGGETYCASVAIKWAGTGGTPFVAIQPSSSVPVWVIGSAGYVDPWGPVLPVPPSPDWQRLGVTVTLPAGETQARFVLELWSGVSYAGPDSASFDDFSLTRGVCPTPPPPVSYTVPYNEQFESGTGGWADQGSQPPALATDASSSAGATVMAVNRSASGGDYYSPWIAVTGGETYCASVAIKWAGTGGTPFVAIQPSSSVPVWVIGSAGYVDPWGPVLPVPPSPDWRRLGVTVTLPAGETQARFVLELWNGVSYGGPDSASFDDFSLTPGACPTSPPPVSYTVPYNEQFESGTGGWADQSGQPPTLATDASSSAGATVMAVNRSASGGDYYSPWIAVTGGEAYCASVAIKWAGTGGTPFVAIQPSSSVPVWVIGSAGYVDPWGPVLPVPPSPDWQRLGVTVTLPAGTTQARFVLELWNGVSYGGPDSASFDDFSLTPGACPTPPPPMSYTVPYNEQFESGTGGWADQGSQPPTLATDASSSAGATVMAVNRSASGGDYYSPWIAVTGGETYCASVAIKWAGTGGTPFVAIQPSSSVPVWVIGSAGYVDPWGPVLPVPPSPDWQRLGVTVTLPPGETQARFVLELWNGVSYAGPDSASFDDFSLTSGACPTLP